MVSNGQRYSAADLTRYWRYIDDRVEGESYGIIPASQLPPWQDLCENLGWRLATLSGGSFSKKSNFGAGVYRVISLNAAGDFANPEHFNRIRGIDTSGTLYIGETRSLHTRLNQLIRSGLRSNQDSHKIFGLMRRIPCLKFDFDKLAVAFIQTGVSHFTAENDLIRSYMNTFGDTPPLNYSPK